MDHSNDSELPSPSAEHRRVASGQFEHANQVIATRKNYDYGIHLLLKCCLLDPANLIYRQALRRTQRAKYNNNLRGSRLAWLTTWPIKARLKAARRSKDHLKVLEFGERVLVRNPWDVGTQMTMAESMESLGLLDMAIWCLEQARHKKVDDVTVNRALALLLEQRGNFNQAMALWLQIRKVKPTDEEAAEKLKDLAVHDTIQRGRYEGAIDGGPSPAHPAFEPAENKVEEGTAQQEVSKETTNNSALPSRVARDAAPLRKRIQVEPTSSDAYLNLAKLYRRAQELDNARHVLEEGLSATGNTFELQLELADLEIEPFRKNLAVTEKKLESHPEDDKLRQLRIRLRKEINTRELEYHRLKADRHPTELVHRLEIGIRLLRAGLVDEAIQELQAARNDPRSRWQTLYYLGHCFKARNNWRLAQRNFEEALQTIATGGDQGKRKELLFVLAEGYAQNGDLNRAIDLGSELANEDFSYKEIGRLLDEWQARSQNTNVSP
jgi:tetratricopeptide (TPR) repeat protein